VPRGLDDVGPTASVRGEEEMLEPWMFRTAAALIGIVVGFSVLMSAIMGWPLYWKQLKSFLSSPKEPS
jgi:hypothetical protein